MLPALRLTAICGHAPDHTPPVTQLWWFSPTFTAVCYLHDNGRVRGAHLWMKDDPSIHIPFAEAA